MAWFCGWSNPAAASTMPSSVDEASKEEKDAARDLRRTALFVALTMLIGVIALFIWASAQANDKKIFSSNVVGLGLLLLGGAALIGGVLGLLFGIPKSVSDPAATAPPRDQD